MISKIPIGKKQAEKKNHTDINAYHPSSKKDISKYEYLFRGQTHIPKDSIENLRLWDLVYVAWLFIRVEPNARTFSETSKFDRLCQLDFQIFKLLGTVTLIFSENVCNCYLMMNLLIAKPIISVWVSTGLYIVQHFVQARFVTMVSNISDLHEFKDKFWYFWKEIEQGSRFTDYFLYVWSGAGWACIGIVWVRICILTLRTNRRFMSFSIIFCLLILIEGLPLKLGIGMNYQAQLLHGNMPLSLQVHSPWYLTFDMRPGNLNSGLCLWSNFSYAFHYFLRL